MTVGPLIDLLGNRSAVALTGAGISTESGIPDYRGDGTRQRARHPIQHAEFLRSAEVRQRYWARSYLGWPRMSAARPNRGHRALAALEESGHLRGVITQNVDSLHDSAGSRRVVELHGALARVDCLDCDDVIARSELQRVLARLNPGVTPARGGARPDGDQSLADDAARQFRVAPCPHCGGRLKPGVVFFGGTVAKPTTDAAWALYREAELLLVVGSSLAVFSGYRFVRQAHLDSLPVAIVNRGETRGDAIAAIRIGASAGETLDALVTALVSRS